MPSHKPFIVVVSAVLVTIKALGSQKIFFFAPVVLWTARTIFADHAHRTILGPIVEVAA